MNELTETISVIVIIVARMASFVKTVKGRGTVARPRTTLLNREIIGRAAVEFVDSGNELQLVPLAKKLGVSVSSLYHHVQGREGVIRAMRHVLVTEYFEQGPTEGTWEERIRGEVHRSWRMYAEHPGVLQLMLTVVIDEPDLMHYYGALAQTLEEAGLAQSDILTTIEVIDAFSFGAALDALSPARIFDAERASVHLATLMNDHPSGDERNTLVFERGLDFIIAGIRARVDAIS